ncbi:DUF4132 domain-containing protein [Streptomyces sp. NPDC048409]|uniref:DUF4132 domain-containing protein n=1 Tax=Streptomyces sp. NPDC048409 TaxID=3154723 RepID=UPI0034234279
MRRWECTQRNSSKFWEAEVSGTVMSVRYGRTGTQGQEQHKEFADATAARAHLARTITQKERKGYQEVTAGTTGDGAAASGEPSAVPQDAAADGTAAADEPDEDTFRLPALWRGRLYPRRGGVPRRPTAPDPALHSRTLELLRDGGHWTPATFSERTDPSLTQAALAHLEGVPDPFGAAVIGTMATTVEVPRVALVDAWAAQHGLPFAACAALRLLDLRVVWEESEDPRLKRLAKQLTDRSFATFRGQDSPPEHDALVERANAAYALTGPIHPSVAAHADTSWLLPNGRREALDRVRELLADCDGPTYDEAVARLAAHRDDFTHRVVTAYLAPAETGWGAECLADGAAVGGASRDEFDLLRCLPVTAEQIATVVAHDTRPASPQEWATVAEGAGTDVDRLIIRSLELQNRRDKPTQLRRALAEIPTDRAFAYLLDRVGDKDVRPCVVQAAGRFPRRALRLLAGAAALDGPGSTTHSMLVAHVGTHPETTAEQLPTLDAQAAAVVRAILDESGRIPDAADLPALLTSPPWAGPRSTARPRTVPGLTAPGEPHEAWLPGERAAWAAVPKEYFPPPGSSAWKWEMRRLESGEMSQDASMANLYMDVPEAQILPLLDGWEPGYFPSGPEDLKPLVAHFGVKAHTFLVRLAARDPRFAPPLLMPFVSVAVARLAADWLVRLKTAAAPARDWLERHGPRAAGLLVPDALGAAAPARRAAEAALLFIATRHGDGVVRAAAEGYGSRAAAAVGQLMDRADPLLDSLPRTMPVQPDWADPGLLPQIAVRAGGALPVAATRHVVTVLALGRPGLPYPGLAVVQETCDPVSLAEFAWRLFQRWREAHMPAKESWALTALGVLGDDETVRRLAPVIRALPGESAHRRAVEGLDVLAEIGTDVALTHLHGIAQRVRFTGLRERAEEKIGEVAAGLGLTTDQLADRLVPDLGLDPDGTTVIDYGPRRFTVGFDELLRPYVLDGAGHRRKDLPKPGAGDDTDIATAGRKRYSALKKDVRAVAADRIARLETAMVRGGTWTAAEFRGMFAGHPLMRHPARCLVWLSDDGYGERSFRVAEDGTFADRDDDTFELPENATVRIPHPMRLGDALGAWQELFADYEILQPFRQLARPVLAFTPEEAADWTLRRFVGRPIRIGALMGLTRRGWTRMPVADAGHFGGIYKQLGPGQVVHVIPGEGLNINSVDHTATDELTGVWIREDFYDLERQGCVRFGDVDPLTASELLLDLTSLVEAPL